LFVEASIADLPAYKFGSSGFVRHSLLVCDCTYLCNLSSVADDAVPAGEPVFASGLVHRSQRPLALPSESRVPGCPSGTRPGARLCYFMISRHTRLHVKKKILCGRGPRLTRDGLWPQLLTVGGIRLQFVWGKPPETPNAPPEQLV
jgi:hypothetical protein